MKDAIKTYLLTQAGVTKYVGNDIYHAQRPQGLLTDYICFGVLVPSNDPVVFGSDTANHKWRFDIFSMNSETCWVLGELLYDLFNRVPGPIGGLDIYFSTAVGPKVIIDTSDEQWSHGMVDATIGYRRT
jgi:hypothetical protein